MGYQKVVVFGNLGKDPETKYFPSGDAVTNFSVAVSRKWNGKDGERKEETEWFNCSCFGKTAEIAQSYLAKGHQVLLEGRLRTRSWEGQDGEKKYRTELVVDNLVLVGNRATAERESEEIEMPF